MILLNFITTSCQKAPEFTTFSLLTGKWAIGNRKDERDDVHKLLNCGGDAHRTFLKIKIYI
ncbi:hypothetical protein ACLBR5_01510 [Escherichia coli]